MLEHGSIKLYKISESKKEYERLRRTITSENKLNDFSANQVNEVLRESVANKYQKADRVILIHDPSEIRKRHTKTAENIGRVKSLDNRIINGYSSFNTVVVEPEAKQISLVQHELYSNRQVEFLSTTLKTPHFLISMIASHIVYSC